jgi:hypothetical protein
MQCQMTINVLRRTWIYQTIILVAVLVASVSPSVATNKASKDHGVTFENVSALLGPYTREASGGGLGGIA